MVDGWITWDWKSSCTSDWDEELENWQNFLHKVSTLQYNMMTKSLCCISAVVRKLTYYDGLTNIDMFLDEFEHKVLEDHHFQALELALCATSARWWGTHKDSFDGWWDYMRMMKLRFGHANTRMTKKYNGKDDPRYHLETWTKAWGMEPQPKLVHTILSYLGYNPHELIPRNRASPWHCGMGCIERRVPIEF